MDIVSKAWCRESRIAELEANYNECNEAWKQSRKHALQLIAENKRYREALALIVADSCSLQPSSEFMSQTALKALEQNDE